MTELDCVAELMKLYENIVKDEKMKKNKISKYVLISCAIIIVYLIADFFNIFNFITKELNFDALAILVNAVVVIFVFAITYSLVNKKTFEHEQEINCNKSNLLHIILKQIYNYCRNTLDMLDNDSFLKQYIVPKVDFNSTNDKIMENLKCLPFQNEKYIIDLFSSGIAKDSIIKEYFEIKELYQKYINMRITFFDIDIQKSTAENEELYNLLATDREILKSKLNKALQQ